MFWTKFMQLYCASLRMKGGGVFLALFLAAFRRALLLCINPSFQYRLHDRLLWLPFSHQLPIYLARFPNYDSLVRRLSKYLHSQYDKFVMIDVGANIGDTMAASAPTESDRILAIEASDYYYRYLTLNFGQSSQFLLLNKFCSSQQTKSCYRCVTNTGTASFVIDPSGRFIEEHTLDQIVTDNPTYLTPQFLKIDTDGYDLDIILGAESLIRNARPAILFEWLHNLYASSTDKLDTIVTLCNEAGYSHVLVYDNFGTFVIALSLKDEFLPWVQTLSSNNTNPYYYDLLFLSSVMSAFVEMEQALFGYTAEVGCL